ncbi:hypothetical protein ACQ4PT_014060 [Festuca glaucescens]
MAPVMLLLLFVAVVAAPVAAELPRLEQSPKADGWLTILAVGDWGRHGEFNQSRVSPPRGEDGCRLHHLHRRNFYSDGLTGVDDKRFEDFFTGIYTAKSLQKPWYTVLGNHDYRGDALAQISPVLQKVDSQWISIKSFVVNAGK